MYASKRNAYKYSAYKARNELAAIDYMYHKDREILQNRNGETR